MNIGSINFFTNEISLPQKVKDLFIPTATDLKMILVACTAFALFMVYRTCCYYYYNGLKPIADGQNKCIDILGLVHEGEFKNGRLNGQGKREMLFGSVAEGDFVNGSLGGQGKISGCYLTGEIHEGEFKNGKFAEGTCTYSDHKKYTLFGDVVRGDVLEGKFPDSVHMQGKGKITRGDGTIEEGNFYRSRLEGKGKITYPDGTIKKGIFHNGRLTG